jgi:ATP-dependent Zn protease
VQIFIKVPNESQRIGILESLKEQNPGFESIDCESVGKKTPGYVGADLIRLTQLAVLKAHVSN